MTILYVLLALLILGLLTMIHEFGHFIVAKLCGVRVLEFAVGMGPRLFSHRSKKSGTIYSLRAFPIGGYVSMFGDADPQTQPKDAIPSDEKPSDQSDFLINSEDPDEDTPEPVEPEPVDPELAKQMYCNQAVWKRILISVAGPVMNLLLGFLLMFGIVAVDEYQTRRDNPGFTTFGTTEVVGFFVEYTGEDKDGFRKGDYLYMIDGEYVVSLDQVRTIVENSGKTDFDVTVRRPVVNEDGIMTDVEIVTLRDETLSSDVFDRFTKSLSDDSGLRVGDRVVKVSWVPVHTSSDLQYEIANNGYQPVDLTVIRNGERIVLEKVVFPTTVDEESGIVSGAMDFTVNGESDFTFRNVVKYSWFRSLSFMKSVLDSLTGIVSGRYGIQAVSGPIGITKTVSDVAKVGFGFLLTLVAFFSINLGVINLLPLPALDGGHILLYLIEAIRRKPVPKQVEGIINAVGFILIMLFAFIIAIKDVFQLI